MNEFDELFKRITQSDKNFNLDEEIEIWGDARKVALTHITDFLRSRSESEVDFIKHKILLEKIKALHPKEFEEWFKEGILMYNRIMVKVGLPENQVDESTRFEQVGYALEIK